MRLFDEMMQEKSEFENEMEELKQELIETKEHNRQLAIELEKKDKIINEMAKYIDKLDIDEDICTKNVTNPEYCNEYYTNCKKCIIEYFTKKVEG